MQLIKINPLQAQPAQAAFAGGCQVFRLSIFNPLVGTEPVKAALGGDHQPRRIGVQRLSYDFFTHAGTIGVRGVDEIDSQFDCAPQDPDGLSPIRRLAPNSISRDTHRAESQARNAKVVSDQEFASLFRGYLVSLHVSSHCGLVILHMFSLQLRKLTCRTLLSLGVTRRKQRCKKMHVHLRLPQFSENYRVSAPAVWTACASSHPRIGITR